MRRNRALLGLEMMEARNSPSSLNSLAAAVPAHVSTLEDGDHWRHSHEAHHLLGNGHGHYTSDLISSGAGKTTHLTGMTHLDDRGDFAVTGWLHSVGFIQSGHASGDLTLKNAHGSIEIELVGPVQKGFSALPHEFHYRVVSATGAYEGLKAHGEVDITRHAVGDAGEGTFHLHFERR